MAQIKAGKFQLIFEEFDIENNLTEVLTMLMTQTTSKNLYLQLELDLKVPPRIVSDPNRFRQIIINLVSNSVKFTPSGGIKVKVTAVK